ncbi:MAG: hypothetical protein L6R28_07540 [Planctomycetes bacterium]|nr:hypothetical protein [Planctomycetota bacterium]
MLYRDILPKNQRIPEDAYPQYNIQPQVIYVQEPVRVIEQPVIIQDRRPAFCFGIGFEGGGHKPRHPKPRKCK